MPKPNPEAPTVLVDMDGVVAGFDEEVLDRLTERYPHIPIVTRTHFYVADDHPEHRDLVRGISNEQGFFASLPVVAGALYGWGRILESGRLPRICSSPIRTNPYSEAEKLGWLEEHFAPVFGSWVVEQAIITSNKAACDGIALIDDRPKVEGADRAVWQHIIFDRPFNGYSPTPRLNGWDDGNLETLLHAAEVRAGRR